jgi:ribosome-binding protein aMBF1 (putative translation factor)
MSTVLQPNEFLRRRISYGPERARSATVCHHEGMSTAVPASPPTSIFDLLERARDIYALPSPAVRRALRQQARLSLKDVGDALGVSPEAIRNWESGRRTPRPEHLHGYVSFLRALQGIQS